MKDRFSKLLFLLQGTYESLAVIDCQVNPVIAGDGHTYERPAIQSWLALHQTSPVIGAALSHAKLVPNVIIRGVIQQQLC